MQPKEILKLRWVLIELNCPLNKSHFILCQFKSLLSLVLECESRRERPINKQATLIAHKIPDDPMLNDALSEPIGLLCSLVLIASKLSSS